MRLLLLIFLLSISSICLAQKQERIEAYLYFKARLGQTVTVGENNYEIDSLEYDQTLSGELLLRTVYLSGGDQVLIIKMVSNDPRETSLLEYMINPVDLKNIQTALVMYVDELIEPM